MANKGFLLVTMQPPPAFEEEFNAWYDGEHIPERLAVPGILTGRRFVNSGGHPKYLAMYDLESHAVMSSPGYLAVGFENASPWTRRVTSRVRPWRSTGDQIWPGNRLTRGGASVLLMRFRGLERGVGPSIIDAARRVFEERPETLQARVLAHDAGKAGIDFMVFVEQRWPVSSGLDMAPFARHSDHIDLLSSFAPY